VEGKTWAELRQARQHGSRGEAVLLWEGVNVTTNNKLRIDQRTDRALLVSVYESSKQIYSVCAWDFGDLPASPLQPARLDNSDATIQKALSMIQPFVEKYAAGEIETAADLKLKANQELEKCRQRKTPLGKKGLADFLKGKGHPAPWAQDGENQSEKKRGSEQLGNEDAKATTKKPATSSAPEDAPPPKAMKSMKSMMPMKAMNTAMKSMKAMKTMTAVKRERPKMSDDEVEPELSEGAAPTDEDDEDDDDDGAKDRAAVGLRSSSSLSANASARIAEIAAMTRCWE
jgi:hypothetical protein